MNHRMTIAGCERELPLCPLNDELMIAGFIMFGDPEITVATATCTQTGLEKRTCSVCEKVEESALPALGHDFSAEWTVDKQATCEAAGSKSHHCSRCDEKSEVTAIPAIGHSWGSWVKTKEPTFINFGELTRICANCGRK